MLAVALLAAWSFEDARTVMVIHGGLGVPTDAELAADGATRADLEKGLATALRAGQAKLDAGKSAAEAVEAAIRTMEDSPLFNAGRGAVLTSDGRAQLDAAIMEGTMVGAGPGKADPRKRAGAVAATQRLKNPISAARAVMEMGGPRHALLVGPDADAYFLDPKVQAQFALEVVDNTYFRTERRLREHREQRERRTKPAGQSRFDTVGAVALGRDGHLAAGTSTGGMGGKLPGRVGDAPLIGSGTYADDRACGVSCTGTGEVFIRHGAAHDVIARMVYAKQSVAVAAKGVIDDLPDEPGGVGGLIALDPAGRHAFALAPLAAGMARAYLTADGRIFVMLRKDDAPKPMP